MFAIIKSRLSSVSSKALVNLLFTPSTYNFQNTSKILTFIHNTRFKHASRFQLESPRGSKYAPPSPIESATEYISSLLKNKNYMSEEEWDDFKSNLFDHEQFISEENFSSIVMNTLLTSNQMDLSRNFLTYVENSNVKPNFLTYLQYISLCSKNRKYADQTHILKIIDKVKTQIDASPILDMKRAEYIIQGLCATDKWQESFQYLDKLTSKPNREMSISLACAAIRNNNENLAWEILTKWINPYESVGDRIIEEFLLVALKMQQINCSQSDELIEKIFHYMRVHDIIISVDVAKLIEQYFKSHHFKWNVTYTKVGRVGSKCNNCRQHLQMLQLGNQDFSDLREAFLKRAVMKSDLYINTNENEFSKYMEFIDMYKPFHIVVDGLNAAYTFQGFLSKKNLSSHLLRVIKKLSGKSRHLLVLGRKHMKGWPGIHKISERAKLFFTDNISQDDPFVIYAALASGPHTLFLSGDLMRDHLARLDDPRLIHLFKRWQLSHQTYLQHNEYNDVRFVEPVRHSITVYGTMEKGWHIPFDDKIILDPYEELNNWLCITKCI